MDEIRGHDPSDAVSERSGPAVKLVDLNAIGRRLHDQLGPVHDVRDAHRTDEDRNADCRLGDGSRRGAERVEPSSGRGPTASGEPGDQGESDEMGDPSDDHLDSPVLPRISASG